MDFSTPQLQSKYNSKYNIVTVTMCIDSETERNLKQFTVQKLKLCMLAMILQSKRI